MLLRTHDDEGFGLVEIVIAMFLFGIIALALLPMLVTGVQYSTEQSSVATATRQLNALIDDARQQPSCASLGLIVGTKTFEDGRNVNFTTSGSVGADFAPSGPTGDCTPGASAALKLTAVQGAKILGTVEAFIFIPPATTP